MTIGWGLLVHGGGEVDVRLVWCGSLPTRLQLPFHMPSPSCGLDAPAPFSILTLTGRMQIEFNLVLHMCVREHTCVHCVCVYLCNHSIHLCILNRINTPLHDFRLYICKYLPTYYLNNIAQIDKCPQHGICPMPTAMQVVSVVVEIIGFRWLPDSDVFYKHLFFNIGTSSSVFCNFVVWMKNMCGNFNRQKHRTVLNCATEMFTQWLMDGWAISSITSALLVAAEVKTMIVHSCIHLICQQNLLLL